MRCEGVLTLLNSVCRSLPLENRAVRHTFKFRRVRGGLGRLSRDAFAAGPP